MNQLKVDGRRVAGLEIASTTRARGKGLLGRDTVDGALWLKRCRHVHTMRMKFALDIASIDKHGTVIAVQTLIPNRFARFHWRTRSVLEADAGAFASWGLVEGSRIAADHDS